MSDDIDSRDLNESRFEAKYQARFKNYDFALNMAKIDYGSFIEDEIKSGTTYRGYFLDGQRGSATSPVLVSISELGGKNLIRQARRDALRNLDSAIDDLSINLDLSRRNFVIQSEVEDWNDLQSQLREKYYHLTGRDDSKAHHIDFRLLQEAISKLLGEMDLEGKKAGATKKHWRVSAAEYLLLYRTANGLKTTWFANESKNHDHERYCCGYLWSETVIQLVKLIRDVEGSDAFDHAKALNLLKSNFKKP